MNIEVYDDPQAFMDAVRGKRRGRKGERRKAGEGTGSRTQALDELARAGWHVYGGRDGAHWFRHRSGRVVEAESYDGLLDVLLKEVRGK